jgi:hypothetical protein
MSLVRIFGLVIDSEVSCDKLSAAPLGAAPDVVIRCGHVGDNPDLVISGA